MFSSKVKQAKTKIMVFPMGELFFGTRLEQVLRVVAMPNVFKSGEKLLGIANFEDQEVVVVDLYQKVFGQPLPKRQGFLLILGGKANLYGLTVPNLPILREIPIADLHALPANYRDRDSLGVASHMFQIPEKEIPQTVFLLDTDLLLTMVDQAS
ncbi:MAG: chemotaxis protein CheW [Pseudanabaenaceae cyanobacterium bins.68]|nr:chemotaxis protein CheW [Pseudanabaenaceae cyanobacterium bins.68]